MTLPGTSRLGLIPCNRYFFYKVFFGGGGGGGGGEHSLLGGGGTYPAVLYAEKNPAISHTLTPICDFFSD